MNCVINDIVAEIVPSLHGSVCDTSCSSSSRKFRFLETDKYAPSTNDEGFDVPNVLGRCRSHLVEQVSFGDATNAAQAFTACIQDHMVTVLDAASLGNNNTAFDGNLTKIDTSRAFCETEIAGPLLMVTLLLSFF
jgi:hypothetical protein